MQHSDQIRHYIEPTAAETLQTQKVYGVVDRKRRLINARYHTAGHLLSNISFEEQFYKLPYRVPENKKFRVMQIGDMSPVPCGGTHISYTGEIGCMRINKIKNKSGTLRISYEVT